MSWGDKLNEKGNSLEDSLDASRFSLDEEFPVFEETSLAQRSFSAPLPHNEIEDDIYSQNYSPPLIGDNAHSYEDSVISDVLAPSPLFMDTPPPPTADISEINLSHVPQSPLFPRKSPRGLQHPLSDPLSDLQTTPLRDPLQADPLSSPPSNAALRSSRRGSYRQFADWQSSSRHSSARHPLIPRQSPHKSVNSAAEKLDESDWNYLSTICEHLDSQEEAMYSSDSLKSIARHLRLPELTSEALDILMFINVYRTDTWANSLSQIHTSANSVRHEKFLAEKRELQTVLAEKFDRIKTTRDFLDRYKTALTSEIFEPNAILHQYEMKKLVPKYISVWRAKSVDVGRIEQTSHQVRSQNVCKLWVGKLRRLNTLDTKAGMLRNHKLEANIKATIFRLWRSHTNRATENELFANRFHERKLWSTYYKKLTLETRERKATKLFKRSSQHAVLQYKFQQKLQNLAKLEARASKMHKQRVLPLWRKKAVTNINGLYYRQNQLLQDREHRKQSAVLAHWRRETKLAQCQTNMRRQELGHRFRMWRMNSKVLLEQRKQDVQTTQLVFNNWRHAARYVESVYEKLAHLELQVSSCIASAALNEMRNALSIVADNLERAPELYTHSVKTKHFNHMRLKLNIVKQQSERAANYNHKLTKQRALQSLISKGTELREIRVNSALNVAKDRIDRRRQSHLLNRWNIKTQQQRRTYHNVSRFTDENSARSLLRYWRQNVRHNYDLEAEASLQYHKLLFTKVLLRAREHLTDLQSSFEAAELLDITRLGSVFKTKLRWWQSQSRQVKSMIAQADSYRHQSQRSSALEYLQGWRMQSEFSRQDVNSSISLSRTNLYNQRTPRKRLTMSPQALQKWYNNSEYRRRQERDGGSGGRLGTSRSESSILMALDAPSPFQRDTPIPRRPQDLTTSTPTKPNRF